MIAPLGSLTMVMNAFIAPAMHGEKVRECFVNLHFCIEFKSSNLSKLGKNIVVATALIVLGCGVAVASASHSNDVCGIDKLFALYSTPRFVMYAMSTILVMGGTTLSIRRFEGEKIRDFLFLVVYIPWIGSITIYVWCICI